MRHSLQYLSLFYVSCLFSSTEIILSPKSERRRAHMSWTRAGSSLSLASAKKHLGPVYRGKLIGTCATNKAVRVDPREDDAVKLADRLTWRLCHCLRARLFFVLFPRPVCGGGGGAVPSIARLPLPLSLRGWFFLPAFHFQRERN